MPARAVSVAPILAQAEECMNPDVNASDTSNGFKSHNSVFNALIQALDKGDDHAQPQLASADSNNG